MWAGFRQRLFPREFRIGPPPWPAGELSALERALSGLAKAGPGGGAVAEGVPDQGRLLAGVATGLWRLGRRLRSDEAARRACQAVFDSAWDALLRGGVEVRDHDGDFVTGGEALRVIAFEPVPGLAREQVIETVRPTVCYQGRVIQMAEVVVGKPAPSGDGPA